MTEETKIDKVKTLQGPRRDSLLKNLHSVSWYLWHKDHKNKTGEITAMPSEFQEASMAGYKARLWGVSCDFLDSEGNRYQPEGTARA